MSYTGSYLNGYRIPSLLSPIRGDRACVKVDSGTKALLDQMSYRRFDLSLVHLFRYGYLSYMEALAMNTRKIGYVKREYGSRRASHDHSIMIDRAIKDSIKEESRKARVPMYVLARWMVGCADVDDRSLIIEKAPTREAFDREHERMVELVSSVRSYGREI